MVEYSALGLKDPAPSFNYRVLVEDAAGSLYRDLAEYTEMDVLLWDLTDERLGVYDMGNDRFITKSIEMPIGEDFDFMPTGAIQHIPFGTDEHFQLWSKKLNIFSEFLDKHGFTPKTRLINPMWAYETAEGEQTPPSFNTTATHANILFSRYLEQVDEHTGIQVITPPEELCKAEASHKWGLAPFHYHAPLYQWFGQHIEESFTR
ncbi:hypothetical protein JZY06_11885 [Corynebacterium sp. CCM 8862]|uniref:Uncharacterized protein n=2 Tax=Corynebacterium mendelii TaxID=2765362 RepID=A0A939IWH8_9CORY|nr:hypothetical protein [Corynebacterium mendelii]